MRAVYQMFRGQMSDAQVLAAAGSDLSAQFFANLYAGLYLEATGNATPRAGASPLPPSRASPPPAGTCTTSRASTSRPLVDRNTQDAAKKTTDTKRFPCSVLLSNESLRGSETQSSIGACSEAPRLQKD